MQSLSRSIYTYICVYPESCLKFGPWPILRCLGPSQLQGIVAKELFRAGWIHVDSWRRLDQHCLGSNVLELQSARIERSYLAATVLISDYISLHYFT